MGLAQAGTYFASRPGTSGDRSDYDTGLTTTTDAAGRWTFTLHNAPPQQVLVAFAPRLRVAALPLVVVVYAKLTLAASGRKLTGTVAPAQPGRRVDIQRLKVDPAATLPSGAPACPGSSDGQQCPSHLWADVASAFLGPGGTTFAATVADAGIYRARLSPEYDQAGNPTAYPGHSLPVVVG